MEWSGLGKQAYSTAFDELKSKGYLIKDKKQDNKYCFYDKPKEREEEDKQIDNVVIEYSSFNGFRF